MNINTERTNYKKCPYCGFLNPKNVQRCINCGGKFRKNQKCYKKFNRILEILSFQNIQIDKKKPFKKQSKCAMSILFIVPALLIIVMIIDLSEKFKKDKIDNLSNKTDIIKNINNSYSVKKTTKKALTAKIIAEEGYDVILTNIKWDSVRTISYIIAPKKTFWKKQKFQIKVSGDKRMVWSKESLFIDYIFSQNMKNALFSKFEEGITKIKIGKLDSITSGDAKLYDIKTLITDKYFLNDGVESVFFNDLCWINNKKIGLKISQNKNNLIESEIYTINIDGNNLRQITNLDEPHSYINDVAFSEDKIVFGTVIDSKNSKSWIMDISDIHNKNKSKKIFFNDAIYNSVFSPKGHKVAFWSIQNNKYGLIIKDINNYNENKILTLDQGKIGKNILWQPNEKQIAFLAIDKTLNKQFIYLIEL